MATRHSCIRTADSFSAVNNWITPQTSQSDNHATGNSMVTILLLVSCSLHSYAFFTVLPEKPTQNFPIISGSLQHIERKENIYIYILTLRICHLRLQNEKHHFPYPFPFEVEGVKIVVISVGNMAEKFTNLGFGTQNLEPKNSKY